MSLDRDADHAPLTSMDELEAYLRAAERPRLAHRLGLEHEKLIYPRGGSAPVPYEGEKGIGALLGQLQALGHEPFREADGQPVIALLKGESTVSLEPGGQLELSGTPFFTAREAHVENLQHLVDLKGAADAVGLYAVALGYRPFEALDQMPWMPKSRYRVMRESLPRRGKLATDMMLMTATGQVSFDWADEADCALKVEVAARLTPLLVALFANSPLVAGRPSGFLSYRSHVWTDVDPSRCGFLPSMFDGSFSYRAYVEWAVEAPLLFLRREGRYLRPELTFRQLLERGYEGQPATRGDFEDHLSTLFPEVRLKKVMELRGADAVGADLTGALAALWRGLLYDPSALFEGLRLLPSLGYEDHLGLMEVARKDGLEGSFGKISIGDAARQMVALAHEGLYRLDPEDLFLLEPLEALAAEGRSPAVRVLEALELEKDPARVLQQFGC